jgi:hypothetical protein
MTSYRMAPLVATVLLVLLSGCSLTGPSTVTVGRPLYNLAVQRTNDEQLLLNLVRLRYRDTTFFLEVASVSTSFEIESQANAGVNLPSAGHSVWDLGLGGRVMEVPTVTYTPLRGQDFVRQVMSPIELRTILLLYHSGWAVDRIFGLCVQRMNGVPNAPSASGPTPARAPVYEDYAKVMRVFRKLQRERALDLGWVGEKRKELTLWVSPDFRGSDEWSEVARILSLPPERNAFLIEVALQQRNPTVIGVIPRSLVSVFFYLSQGVEVPPEDEAAGRVTVTRTSDDQPFAWSEMMGDLLRVRSSRDEPENFAVRTRYRGSWFYIDDSDLSSKSTFALLTQLLQLQGGEVPSTGPLLTLPVTR